MNPNYLPQCVTYVPCVLSLPQLGPASKAASTLSTLSTLLSSPASARAAISHALWSLQAGPHPADLLPPTSADALTRLCVGLATALAVGLAFVAFAGVEAWPATCIPMYSYYRGHLLPDTLAALAEGEEGGRGGGREARAADEMNTKAAKGGRGGKGGKGGKGGHAAQPHEQGQGQGHAQTAPPPRLLDVAPHPGLRPDSLMALAREYASCNPRCIGWLDGWVDLVLVRCPVGGRRQGGWGCCVMGGAASGGGGGEWTVTEGPPAITDGRDYWGQTSSSRRQGGLTAGAIDRRAQLEASCGGNWQELICYPLGVAFFRRQRLATRSAFRLALSRAVCETLLWAERQERQQGSGGPEWGDGAGRGRLGGALGGGAGGSAIGRPRSRSRSRGGFGAGKAACPARQPRAATPDSLPSNPTPNPSPNPNLYPDPCPSDTLLALAAPLVQTYFLQTRSALPAAADLWPAAKVSQQTYPNLNPNPNPNPTLGGGGGGGGGGARGGGGQYEGYLPELLIGAQPGEELALALVVRTRVGAWRVISWRALEG